MATIKHIFKGESLTVLLTFPEAYDMSRIEKHEIYIGATAFTGVVSGKTIELKLTSEQTDVMYGKQEIRLWLDDSVLGVKKPYCGDIIVSNSNAKPANDSTSSISDIIIPIVISETAITAGDVMYNYVKGDKGDPFLYADFTPEQIAELQQPATEAIASIKAVELAVETAEGLRVTAEQSRQTNTATAIQNAETATTNASNAASLANEKAGLANNAAILANEKAGLAATATTQANEARDGANSAAQSATNLVNSYATDLEAKELKSNKQNSLAVDGTGTKFPTVDAVNEGLADKSDSVLFDTTYNAAFLPGVWTADSATDTLTSTVAHGLSIGQQVSFVADTGVLPAGIEAEPDYYYVESVPTTTSLKLKYQRTGTVLDITDNGTLGWKIRNANVIVTSGNILAFDWSLYSEIDMYVDMYQCLGSASNYIGWWVNGGVKTLLNYGTLFAGTINIGISYNKKYVSIPCKVNVRKIADKLYKISFDCCGIYADTVDLATGTTAYTYIYSGKVFDGNITSIMPRSSNGNLIKNGTRVIIVKRA